MARSRQVETAACPAMCPARSSGDQAIIRAATPADAEGVALLHARYISTLGRLESDLRFLQFYYRELVGRSDCAMSVAQDGDAIVGYASLVKNQRQVLFSLIWREPRIIGLLVRRMFADRRKRQYLWFQLRHEIMGRKWDTVASRYSGCHELRSVAVGADCRGHALGTRLLEACLAGAHSRSWGPIIAWVSADNIASQRLFEKVGFRRVLTKLEGDRQVYLYCLDHAGNSTQWSPAQQTAER